MKDSLFVILLVTVPIALIILAITNDKDRGECLHSHDETTMQYVPTDGKGGFMLIPVFNTICDKWEFPNGRPQAGQ